MGIQDKIFDVEHALEGKPEKKLFNELVGYISRLETALETAVIPNLWEYMDLDFADVRVPVSITHSRLERHYEKGWEFVQQIMWSRDQANQCGSVVFLRRQKRATTD